MTDTHPLTRPLSRPTPAAPPWYVEVATGFFWAAFVVLMLPVAAALSLGVLLAAVWGSVLLALVGVPVPLTMPLMAVMVAALLVAAVRGVGRGVGPRRRR